MSSYAANVAPLAISGSRTSTGAVNDSGKVWFYQLGTSTTVNAYSDAAATVPITQPITLDSGGRIPAANYPDGVFITQPVRLLIQSSAGATVSDTDYIPSTAGATGLSNAGFTDSTADGAYTKAYASFGGQDWKYLESAGATARTIKAKFSELSISVKDFGAVGDGVASDTTAVQAAVSRIVALGGGVVFFPPGTYLLDQAIAATSAVGLRIVGTGWASRLQFSNGTANGLTFATAATTCSVEDLRITHTGTSTGAAIAVASGTDFLVKDVAMLSSDFAYGCDFSGSTNWKIVGGQIEGSTRGIRSNTSGSDRPSFLYDAITGGGAATAVEINGSQGRYRFYGWFPTGATGLLLNAAYTGTDIVIHGATGLGALTTPIDMTGLATDPVLRVTDSGVDGYVVTQASGGGGGSNHTPNRAKGSEVHVRLTSGGAAVCTINAPTPVPTTGMRGVRLTLRLTAAAGGNITWTFPAVYVLIGGGTTIVGTDGNTDTVQFNWDVQTSEWRQLGASAVTLT
jgi:hypothetical protein